MDYLQRHAFTKFRRRLEDAVLEGINTGKVVSATNHDCYCPLGCFPGLPRRPWEDEAVKELKGIISLTNLVNFADGFDGNNEYRKCSASNPYFRLGRLYRKRFP